MEPTALVSVIISTRNEAASIKTLLTSLKSQTYPALQIIVVDNHSTDGTASLAGQTADLVLSAGPERSAQRNLGAQASRGDYLLFLDADMELPPTLVERAVQAMLANPGAGLIAIPELSDGDNFWARCKALERNCYVDEPSVMAARFFARQVFMDAGGYDETLTGPEDWDLSQRAAQTARLMVLDIPLVHHEGSFTLIEQLKKKLYYARSFARYLRKHPGRAVAQAGLLRRSAFWRHRKKLAAQPALAAGMLLLRLLESCAGLAGALYGLRAGG